MPTETIETAGASMPLTSATYGKGRVRVMRLARDGDHHTPRELALSVMLTGGFDAAWTAADNRACIATDTMKNIVNVVAAQNPALGAEGFVQAVAALFLETYPQVETVTVEACETRWLRAAIGGAPHGHTFTLDGNGFGYVRLAAGRDGSVLHSGLRGFTLMKTTQSGWSGFFDDAYRTLPDTDDRIAATSMDATWTWRAIPADYAAANAAVLEALIAVFGTTYSHGVQDSMYRMGEAALAAVPEIAEIAFAMPNKHYVPINLAPFGLENPGTVFLPTDEPHGQIEAVIGRG
jgi:urate oxidase